MILFDNRYTSTLKYYSEFERTREFYGRLLDRTKHLKVCVDHFTQFECSTMEGSNVDLAEDNMEDYIQEQKKQCIQRARSKQS